MSRRNIQGEMKHTRNITETNCSLSVSPVSRLYVHPYSTYPSLLSQVIPPYKVPLIKVFTSKVITYINLPITDDKKSTGCIGSCLLDKVFSTVLL